MFHMTFHLIFMICYRCRIYKFRGLSESIDYYNFLVEYEIKIIKIKFKITFSFGLMLFIIFNVKELFLGKKKEKNI